MKVIFEPIVRKVSGKLGNLVFSPYNNIVNIAGEETVSGIIRTIGEVKENVRRNNVNRAFSIASEKWEELNNDDKNGWDIEAKKISITSGVNRSARVFFIGYYVNKYASQLSTFVTPTDLDDGADYTYDLKSTRSWS